jgi:hypothetical protein
MLDLAMVVCKAGFFLVAIAYVHVCEWLRFFNEFLRKSAGLSKALFPMLYEAAAVHTAALLSQRCRLPRSLRFVFSDLTS